MSTDPVSPEPATWVTDPRTPVRVWLESSPDVALPHHLDDITDFQAAADAIRVLFPSTPQPINLEPVSGRPDGGWLVDLPTAIYDLVVLSTDIEVTAVLPTGVRVYATVTAHS